MLRRLLRQLIAERRIDWLALRAFWHGLLHEDWTEDQFDAAIREMYELRRAARDG